MTQGDILYAKGNTVIGTGAIVDTTKYDPWSTSIIDQIALLDNPDAKPTGEQIPLFIGAATYPPERKKLLQWEFGDAVGVFTGKVKILSGVSYSQVTVQLRAYYGVGDDIPQPAKVWVRTNDVTNNQKELTALASSGDSGGVTVSDLNAKRQSDALTNKVTTGTGTGNGIISTITSASNLIWYALGALAIGVGIWYYRTRNN
ncbi:MULTISPECIES: hypothetical protein [unclassified Arcicella]|uniref:hypothetical protein n=1 Tax=unclassified Arcicella TaxID=2644986 RepID=UPI00285B3438|nr:MULTISPECIES: hypothetical protein [unclassified Arcicella]MDR6564961.1 hypothetical protein [Arcicella sp. BE51]MDR6814751.1 hypothetical protein [Arcicella sp. BE140]MDR6826197.1 hypothetical protein [Arcicella sp. BE139]